MPGSLQLAAYSVALALSPESARSHHDPWSQDQVSLDEPSLKPLWERLSARRERDPTPHRIGTLLILQRAGAEWRLGAGDRDHSVFGVRDAFGKARSRILSGRKPDHISPLAVSTMGTRIQPASLKPVERVHVVAQVDLDERDAVLVQGSLGGVALHAVRLRVDRHRTLARSISGSHFVVIAAPIASAAEAQTSDLSGQTHWLWPDGTPERSGHQAGGEHRWRGPPPMRCRGAACRWVRNSRRW